MHNQVLEKVATMQREVTESRKKLHNEVVTRISARQTAYDELVTEISKIQGQMENQVSDELEQRKFNQKAYDNWCNAESKKIE